MKRRTHSVAQLAQSLRKLSNRTPVAVCLAPPQSHLDYGFPKVVCINQVTIKFRGSGRERHAWLTPSLGDTWAHMVTHRIALQMVCICMMCSDGNLLLLLLFCTGARFSFTFRCSRCIIAEKRIHLSFSSTVCSDRAWFVLYFGCPLNLSRHPRCYLRRGTQRGGFVWWTSSHRGWWRRRR